MVWKLHLNLTFTTQQSKYGRQLRFTICTELEGVGTMDNWLEEWIEMIDFEMDEQQQPASKKRKFSLRNIMLKGTAQTRAALEFLPRH
jgi:hypothetical protein